VWLIILCSWNPGLLPTCCCKTCVDGSQLSYSSSESPQAVLGQCNFKAFILQRLTTVLLSAIFHRQHGTSCALVKCKILWQWQCEPASIKIAHYCTHTCHQGLAVAHSVCDCCGSCTMKCEVVLPTVAAVHRSFELSIGALGHGWLGCLRRQWALMCSQSQNRHILFFWCMVTCVGI